MDGQSAGDTHIPRAYHYHYTFQTFFIFGGNAAASGTRADGSNVRSSHLPDNVVSVRTCRRGNAKNGDSRKGNSGPDTIILRFAI